AVQFWQHGAPVVGALVTWQVTRGGATLSDSTTVTDASGQATVTITPGSTEFGQGVEASVSGQPPVDFSLTLRRPFQVQGGGNNVPERYTSDLWLAKGYGYTGTWGYRSAYGNVIKVWQLGGGGAPTLVSSDTIPNVTTISDLQVSPDSTLLVATGEYGTGAGLYVYSLIDPSHPALVAQWWVNNATGGLHTGTLATLNGRLYAFTARDPSAPSLLTFRIQPDSLTPIVLVDSILMPANYGIHDTFERDGLLFVENWNSGLWIYDVGGGGMGGSPENAMFIGSVVTQGGEVHNAWWFHDPVTNEKRYVFVGQEGPDVIGAASNGDIHVVDVSDLSAPAEVARFHLGTNEGPHNFW
ncbi:MAG: Ig-like domain-containing protein, partial [Gemmatimonadales bacterium]